LAGTGPAARYPRWRHGWAHSRRWLRAYCARFFERRSPGERGEDGELTGTEKKEREATEGGVALGETAMALQARGGARVGCLGLEQGRRLLWGLDREARAWGIRYLRGAGAWAARHTWRSGGRHGWRRRSCTRGGHCVLEGEDPDCWGVAVSGRKGERVVKLAREGVRRAGAGTGTGRHAGLRPERGGEGKRPSGQLDRRGNKADGPNLRKGEGNSFLFFKPFSKPI